MPFSTSAIIGAALAVNQVSALKIGLVSDLHLNWQYDEMTLTPCTDGQGDHTNLRAPMGRYNCDSPEILIETMFHRLIDKFGQPDIIFLTGDFNSHYTAMPVDMPDNDNSTYSLLFSQHAGINQILTKHVPNAIILPAIGNNDSKYHNNP